MRRGVSIQGSILALFLCGVLAACGTSGNSGNVGGSNPPPPPPPPVTMQQGQWEFPVNNGKYFIEANLTDTSGQVTATVYNTAVFSPAQATAFDPPGFTCVNVGLSATISSDTLTGNLDSGGTTDMSFSGTVNSDGQSVSNGTFSEPGQGCAPAGTTSGTFTGYTVPSFTGTYTGQITTWPSGSSPLSFTLTLTQNPDFSISGSGQITGQGIVQTIVFDNSPTGTGVYSGVIGATFALQGTLTDATGTLAIQLTGHANPNATQIAVDILSGPAPLNLNNPNIIWQTGTLTKQ